MAPIGTGIDYRYHAAADLFAPNDIADHFDFVGEYLGADPTDGYLSAIKAERYIDAHLTIISIYETLGMNTVEFFTEHSRANGLTVGHKAYMKALKVGQDYWKKSAIYIAADIDPGTDVKVMKGITRFFQGVKHAFAERAKAETGGKVLFKVGVYGAGIMLAEIKDHEHLAKYGWLAGATAWEQSDTYTKWNLKQVFDIGSRDTSHNSWLLGDDARLFPSTTDTSSLVYIGSDVAQGDFGGWGYRIPTHSSGHGETALFDI